MTELELIPTLEHCIESAARQSYSDMTRRLLAGTSDSVLLEKAEMLRIFLETADFPRLRSESEPLLVNNRRVRFVIAQGSAGVKWVMLTD